MTSLFVARVHADEYGAVYAEYVIVLSLVAVGLGAAVFGLGVLLLALFRFQEALLLLPVP